MVWWREGRGEGDVGLCYLGVYLVMEVGRFESLVVYGLGGWMV